MSAPIDELQGAFQRLLELRTPAPPAGDTVAAPAEGGVPCEVVDFKVKGYHLNATVPPEQVVQTAEFLSQRGFAIDTVTGVDWLAEDQMEVVYDYFHPVSPDRVVVRTRISRAQPEVPTISNIFPGANWHERETHDFFGIRFLGHPDLTPLLLPEDADYHPLRKDYPGA